jgi:hypothetical protein
MASGLKYPTGGLKIIGGNEAEYLPNGLFNISKYFGIVRCKVTPPGVGGQGNYPILPMRYIFHYVEMYMYRFFFQRHPKSHHLMFAYCYPCAVEGDHSKTCTHKWHERGWTATFTTAELEAATKENWLISDVKEVGLYFV